MASSWKEIWERKGDACREISLDSLIVANGFDTGAGKISVRSWEAYVNSTVDRLGVHPGSAILEVGCGAGAFLYPLRNRAASLAGVDYAESLLRVAEKTIPEGRFTCSEAKDLPFSDESFDFVMAHSVLNYFPDHAYVQQAVSEMMRVLRKGGAIGLWDINDEAKESKFISARKKFLGVEEYGRRYRDCPQLFFSRNFFEDFSLSRGLSCEVYDRNVPGYRNSYYRFNVILGKTGKGKCP